MVMMILKNFLCCQSMATLPFEFYKDETRPSSGWAALELAGLIFI